MQNCYKDPSHGSEQTERLTTKHIHTLKFLQEIVAENRDLKERLNQLEGNECRCKELETFAEDSQNRIQQIQNDYLKQADEINAMLAEKHRIEMMKKVEEQLELEKSWAAEKEQLQAEIERLRKENSDLLRQLTDNKQHNGQLKIYELKVEALEQEIARLTEERSRTEGATRAQADQLRKIDFLEDQNKHLKDELSASEQKIKEMEFKIRKLKKDLSEQGQNEQTDILNILKNKLAKMHKDRALQDEREKDLISQLDAMMDENGKLRRALDDSERMRLEMRQQLDSLSEEFNLLRRQATSDKDRQTFKDFILVKRELAAVKEENEALKIKLKFSSTREREQVLPSLKSSDPRNGIKGRPGSGRPSSGRPERKKKDIVQYGVVYQK